MHALTSSPPGYDVNTEFYVMAHGLSMRLADYKLQKGQRPELYILCKDAKRCARLSKLSGTIEYCALSDELKVSLDT